MVTFQGRQYRDWQAARAAMVAPKPILEPTPAAMAVEELDAPGRIEAVSPSAVATVSLVERHRPRRLCEIVGQPEAVAQLAALADTPYPCAVLLAGDTGTGKTSSAWALAGDLGCDLDAQPAEFGGVHNIPSGEHNAASLKAVWPQLWTMPMLGSGWKVLIVNEVEQLSGAVESLWLDRLEDMPPKTVIVFTTNDRESLPDRFVDRCELVIDFESSASRLDAEAMALAGRVWQAETGQEIPADVLAKVMTRATRSGRLSFRRVVQSLVPPLAAKGR